jgi:hypothetical protein
MLLTEKNTVVVRDQPLREESIVPDPVYGPRMVQRMGAHKNKNVRNRSQLNGT